MASGKEVFSTERAERLLNILGNSVLVAGISNGSVDTESIHPHDLGDVPRGFIVISADKGGVFYNSNNSHTSTDLKIKVGIATTVKFIVMVF